MANGQSGSAPPVQGYGKVTAAVAAGALTTIIVYVIDQVIAHPLPPEITDSIQTLVTAGAVYWTPHDVIGGG